MALLYLPPCPTVLEQPLSTCQVQGKPHHCLGEACTRMKQWRGTLSREVKPRTSKALGGWYSVRSSVSGIGTYLPPYCMVCAR